MYIPSRSGAWIGCFRNKRKRKPTRCRELIRRSCQGQDPYLFFFLFPLLLARCRMGLSARTLARRDHAMSSSKWRCRRRVRWGWDFRRVWLILADLSKECRWIYERQSWISVAGSILFFDFVLPSSRVKPSSHAKFAGIFVTATLMCFLPRSVVA